MHFIKLPFIFLFIHSFLLKDLMSTEKAIYNVCVYMHIYIYAYIYICKDLGIQISTSLY